MTLEIFTPVVHGQSATCRVSGEGEPGYIKVKVNGKYAHVLPDDHPGVPTDRRLVFCPAGGKGYDVWTKPPWSRGDSLVFELYDSSNQLGDSSSTTVA